MHKFFKGSRKTIAAMMAILMFTSSTGTYAQTDIIQSSVPDVNTVEEQGDAVDPVVTQENPEDTENVLPNDSSVDHSEDVDSEKDTSVSDETDNNAEEQTSASEADTENVTEIPETTQEDLSEKVERFIQKEKSYEAMEEIDNMQELLAEMDEQELYELLYFMRMSFLCEVQESPDQTLDTYYEILEAYLEVKSGEEWKDVIFPYLPYYEEGMTEEDYLETISKDSKLDILNMNDVLSSLEAGGDPAEGKSLEECEKEAVITIAAECVVQGGPEDAVWTMYHYGYVTDTVMQLEDTDAFFGKLSNPYVFNKLAAYEYYESSPEDFTEKAEFLRKYYKDGNTDDTTLLKYLNEKNDTSYESVEAYEKLLGADFSEVMEAWNAYLSGKTDTLSRKLDTDTGESTESTEESTENTGESQDSTVKENNETSTETDETTEPEVTETIIEDICGYNVTENPFMFTISVKRGKKDSIKEKLPSTLTILANGKEEEIPVTWKATEDVDKTDYDEYMYQLVLPNGYVFSNELSEVAQNYGFSSPYVLVKIINSSKVILEFMDSGEGNNIYVPYYALEEAEGRMPSMIYAILEGNEEPQLIPVTWELDYDFETEEDAVLFRAVLKDGYTLKDESMELPFIMVRVIMDGTTGGGISLFTGAVAGGTWKQDSNGWWYRNPDGSYPNDGWAKINDEWFYFYSNGYMAANTWIGLNYVDGAGYWRKAIITTESEFQGALYDHKVNEVYIRNSFTVNTAINAYKKNLTIYPENGISPEITLNNTIVPGEGYTIVIRNTGNYRITMHGTGNINGGCGSLCASGNTAFELYGVNFITDTYDFWAVHAQGGRLVVDSCNFDNAKNAVGAINSISHGSNITVKNSSFCHSSGESGHAIHVSNSGYTQNLTATGNTIKHFCFGVYWFGDNPSTYKAFAKVDNNTIQNCSHSIDFSGTPWYDVAVTITNNSISGSSVAGIAATNMANFTINDNNVTTSAENGLWLNNSTVSMQRNVINSGKIGVYSMSSTVNYYSGSIYNNSQNGIYIASGWLGMYDGCVYNNSQQGVYSNSLFHLAGGEIRNNNDRGVYINAGTFGMEGGSIHDNTCGGVGGGVYINSGATYNLAGGSIYSNHTDKTGGGIHSEGNLSITGGTIRDNSATGDGGGIWMNKGSVNATITGNTSGNVGGGISVSSGTVTINGGSISNNTASNNGGGIYADGPLNIKAGTNSNNKSGWDGGGIAAFNTVNFTGGTIADNTADWLGGNIHVQATGDRTAVMTVSSTNPISGGTAIGSGGGGISVYGSGAKLILNDGTSVTGNTAKWGGGICTNGTVEMKNATISGNTTSDTSGGGVKVFTDEYGTGQFTMSNGVISNNTATTSGGGIDNGGNLTISGGKISSNTAGTNGGGIYATGTTTFSGGNIDGNKAKSGGGICVGKTASFTMNGGYIQKNTVEAGFGGGICSLQDSEVVITNGTIQTNDAAYGGGICVCGTLSLKDSAYIYNNTAQNGAGLYGYGTGSKILCEGSTRVYNNNAAVGGGIYTQGTVDMSSGRIAGNNASQSGAGLYGDSGSNITVSGGTVDVNSVTTTDTPNMNGGGGVYTAGILALKGTAAIKNNSAKCGAGILANGAEAKVTVSEDALISENEATSGGGVYSENAEVTMTGGSISSNTSKTGLAQAYYQNGTLTVGADAEITGDIYLPVDHIINVDTDLNKAALEVSLAEDDTVAKRVIAEYSADTTSYKAGTDDTARYSLETATAGYANEKSLKIDDNSTAGSVYQVWLDTSGVPVRVHYIGRNAESGTEKADIVQPGTENYQVQHNAGYTGYARRGYTFTGWTDKVNLPTVRFSEKNTDYLSYDELVDIHNAQKDAGITGDMFTKTTASTSVAGFALRAVRNFAVGLFFPVEVQAAEEYMDIYMLDVWDKAPEIKWTENTFYEGVDVFRTDLLGNIQIKDFEDGPIPAEDLVIESITYSAGKLVNGVKEASYTVDYTNGMKDTDKLDTWFMQLDKADSPVTHTLHCSVTDSAGNVTKADIPVKVKYNEFPTIDAQDRYFTLEEAQNGLITKDALLKDAVADGKLSSNDTEDGNISDTITMVDFDISDFTSFEDSGYVTITFHVQDSMGPGGKGKETYRQIKVFVVKDGLVPEVEKAQNVRFISKKYYDRNKDVDPDTLSEEEKEARNSNGGLNVESKWYHEADYRTLIEGTFGKTEGTVYEFDKEDIDNIKAFVDVNGIGALDTFYNQFVAPAKIS